MNNILKHKSKKTNIRLLREGETEGGQIGWTTMGKIRIGIFSIFKEQFRRNPVFLHKKLSSMLTYSISKRNSWHNC